MLSEIEALILSGFFLPRPEGQGLEAVEVSMSEKNDRIIKFFSPCSSTAIAPASP